MKKKIILTALVICTFLTACNNSTGIKDELAKMQMIYTDNPAFFFRDMKLIWNEKVYHEADMDVYEANPKYGNEIGYAVDEYGIWRIYKLKGYYGLDYLLAVDGNNEDIWRIMSINPPEEPLHQFILENVTDHERISKLLSVSLYKDGTAQLAIPPISSYHIPGSCYYVFENNELLIFQEKNNPIAIFEVLNDDIIKFKSSTVPLFADDGARYSKTPDTVTRCFK